MALENDTPTLIVFDEAHKFSEKTTIAMQKVHSFLLKCLDEQNKGKAIQFDADRTFYYDKSQKVICMMSNYDDKMNPALLSRMDVCRLSPYSPEELEMIAVKMITEHGMGVEDEKVLRLLAMASRGTARPLDNMVRELSRRGMEIITKAMAIETMSQLEMFPTGLNGDEVRLLNLARNGSPKNNIKTALPNLRDLNGSISYLMNVKFLTVKGSELFTTPKGAKYLAQLTSNGFIAAA